MSDNSKIEWTDATWNPVRGCTKVSPGCKHCYAETFAERFRGVPGHPFEYGFDLRLVPEKLSDPLRWRTPRMIFVNSMSDLFHEDVTADYVQSVARVMLAANWHTYQVLTKRADRLAEMLAGDLKVAARASHIWWGVSVEDRRYGVPRIEHLRRSPAAVEPIRCCSRPTSRACNGDHHRRESGGRAMWHAIAFNATGIGPMMRAWLTSHVEAFWITPARQPSVESPRWRRVVRSPRAASPPRRVSRVRRVRRARRNRSTGSR
jgi:hypothetical protein